MNDPEYPDAKSSSSFQDGLEYQDFVCAELAKQHIILQNMHSRQFQFQVGENLQGYEIKLDNRCTETGRLSIEIAEKSKAEMPDWTPSGIFRDDNSWLYIQGNREIIFIFDKNVLKRLYEQRHPQIEESGGTVRKFYLPLKTAKNIAAKFIDLTEIPF